MNIWIDTEFTEFHGSLISMALIDENNEYFYEVIEYPEPSQWVKDNVVPILLKEPISKEMFEYKFYNYIKKYDSLHIIADWPDDIKYFCEVLHIRPGEMLNMPSTFTMEIARRLPEHTSALPHNALEDAIAIKGAWLKKQASNL
jgi:hypothetical protein